MSHSTQIASPLHTGSVGHSTERLQRSIDRFAYAHDASHYLLVPQEVLVPENPDDVSAIFAAAADAGVAVTFRSGGTSLSGQGVTNQILVDTRKSFRKVRVFDEGRGVAAQPGATVRQVNTRLLRHRTKLGPDPASEIACTIGGVIANNSSGMSCGTEQNSYQTVESLLLVLPSGTVIDTGQVDAEQKLREKEPVIFNGLLELRDELRSQPHLVESVQRWFSMKNTMGYGMNSFLDFDDPVKILEHLVIGSEGTLAFVAEARFRTIPILPSISTGLLVFESLGDATEALPGLVALGLATVELLDAASLRVAQQLSNVPDAIASIEVDQHAAYLLEVHAENDETLRLQADQVLQHFAQLPLVFTPEMTTDTAERALLWEVRKGLYAVIAGARPSGTTALLEDVVVPVPKLFETCNGLIELFAWHGYEDAVIFGHAKDGNVHFMLTERFEDPAGVERHRAFVEDMVELILKHGGSLKAEHGTGRAMAPFVRRQYGDELTNLMWRLKRLIDPLGMLNPGVLLTDEADSFLQNIKVAPTVEAEVDRCVECGYCEPSCPSKDLTLTPRQRIVLRREIASAEQRGDTELVKELRDSYEYDGVQTCAVDGMCGVACPVDINTGDLVRRLRAEQSNVVEGTIWKGAAKQWSTATKLGGVALTAAKALPTPVVRGATKLGREILGKDRVPLYEAGLPRGGSSNKTVTNLGQTHGNEEVVFFVSCIGQMFGPEANGIGSRNAVAAVLERAGIPFAVPTETGGLCCGTPWKSKGQVEGYRMISERTLASLWQMSRGGEIPVICDAASCTEGVVGMLAEAIAEHPEYGAMCIEDATVFLAREALPRLTAQQTFGRVAVHPTCSTTSLGATNSMIQIAEFVADEVFVPPEWGCCAFAGDRGMLHPELTASATEREVHDVLESEQSDGAFNAYVSANRTCEMGMSRATGKPYRHVVEMLEEMTR